MNVEFPLWPPTYSVGSVVCAWKKCAVFGSELVIAAWHSPSSRARALLEPCSFILDAGSGFGQGCLCLAPVGSATTSCFLFEQGLSALYPFFETRFQVPQPGFKLDM